MPAVAFASAKRGGGYRKLAKLTALDAVLHYAVLDALTPLCEDLFSEFSYAYRPGRGLSQAVSRFRDIVNSAASIAMPQSLIRKAASIISATIDWKQNFWQLQMIPRCAALSCALWKLPFFLTAHPNARSRDLFKVRRWVRFCATSILTAWISFWKTSVSLSFVMLWR